MLCRGNLQVTYRCTCITNVHLLRSFTSWNDILQVILQITENIHPTSAEPHGTSSLRRGLTPPSLAARPAFQSMEGEVP